VRGQLEAFRQGLKEYGWIEGQNISVEYRFAEGKEDALPGIAAELVQLRPDVVVAEGTAAALAAKSVTQTIPIVMATTADPLGNGLVASLNRPGANITGLSLQTPRHLVHAVRLAWPQPRRMAGRARLRY